MLASLLLLATILNLFLPSKSASGKSLTGEDSFIFLLSYIQSANPGSRAQTEFYKHLAPNRFLEFSLQHSSLSRLIIEVPFYRKGQEGSEKLKNLPEAQLWQKTGLTIEPKTHNSLYSSFYSTIMEQSATKLKKPVDVGRQSHTHPPTNRTLGDNNHKGSSWSLAKCTFHRF